MVERADIHAGNKEELWARTTTRWFGRYFLEKESSVKDTDA